MMIDYGEEGDLTNVADKFGQTPLMLAVLGGHTDCVHFLLEKGALPDAKDKRGSTALHRGVGTSSSSPSSSFTFKNSN
ncbi:serine/threonine-protein phosphatase 6 regulatory ankyrin repeat subunit C-like [Notothenia coriiceps]|uniref:Serine/threonine-protein phosphatase 6 regulatory ankyrin repeat subunit C-like n=1 Tax=Notothenia coriiceps TaxID=8208 RepID=A0A6I9N849_9TELE|nr:PREDICTED: serine/threonine-protein phosphatase 6 regulatory ankyrin repeat subunit C-like [Notothenia coriiceps]